MLCPRVDHHEIDGLEFTSVNQCFEKAWADFGPVLESKKKAKSMQELLFMGFLGCFFGGLNW